MSVSWQRWSKLQTLTSKEYICGNCGQHVGSHVGYENDTNAHYNIYICTNCGHPTLFTYSEQIPGPMLGREVGNLPDSIEKIYEEIRFSIKENCHTGAILLGRKLIMHLAVDVANAKEGKKFVEYVDFLKSSGYIPPNGDKILSFIKDLGNEKNHEIKIGSEDESKKMLKFIEGLLIFIYEFPGELEEGSKDKK